MKSMKNEFRRDAHLILTDTKRISMNQYQAVCKTGRTLGRGYAHGSITLHRRGVPSSMTHINSYVLRNALLNSKELVAEMLGLQIIDLHEDVPKEEVYHEETVPVDSGDETPKESSEDTETKETIEVEETPVVQDEVPEPTEENSNKRTTSSPLGDIEEIDKKKLIVDQIFADEGPKIKRIRPRAQGRAYKILKPTCHITVVLTEIN